MSLIVDEKDKYFPANVGIFNVHAGKYQEGNILQQFKYSEAKQAFESIGKPGKIMLEGVNKNIVVYHDKGLPAQKFKYDKDAKNLQNITSGRVVGLIG